jgi:hypothetical protein
MPPLTLKAHYDGEQIRLDEPCDIPRNARLLVTVLPAADGEPERRLWQGLSGENLARAYGDREPGYSVDMVRERNPDYEGG